MKYSANLVKLLSYIPEDVYAANEKQITDLADAIAKDRAKLKEAVLSTWCDKGNGIMVCKLCANCKRRENDYVRLS